MRLTPTPQFWNTLHLIIFTAALPLCNTCLLCTEKYCKKDCKEKCKSALYSAVLMRLQWVSLWHCVFAILVYSIVKSISNLNCTLLHFTLRFWYPSIIFTGFLQCFFSIWYVATLRFWCSFNIEFLSDPGIPGPIYGSGCLKLQDVVADLTDVTLVDEDTNPIPTNNTNKTIQDNVAMPVTNPGDQFENICKWSNGQYWNQCKLPGLLHSFMILLKQTWFFVAPSGG